MDTSNMNSCNEYVSGSGQPSSEKNLWMQKCDMVSCLGSSGAWHGIRVGMGNQSGR